MKLRRSLTNMFPRIRRIMIHVDSPKNICKFFFIKSIAFFRELRQFKSVLHNFFYIFSILIHQSAEKTTFNFFSQKKKNMKKLQLRSVDLWFILFIFSLLFNIFCSAFKEITVNFSHLFYYLILIKKKFNRNNRTILPYQ